MTSNVNNSQNSNGNLKLKILIVFAVVAAFLIFKNTGKYRAVNFNETQVERPREVDNINREYDDNPKYNVNEPRQQEPQVQKQWVNCKKCHGTGLYPCYSCNGTGLTSCGSCAGRGHSGDRVCYTCNGSGKEKCLSCAGVGNTGNCNYCDGRGQVLE